MEPRNRLIQANKLSDRTYSVLQLGAKQRVAPPPGVLNNI